MNEGLNFLQDCGIFFVSTVDGNQPKVRPFSFVMEYYGKICFATSKDFQWLRLSGKAVFCTTRQNKAKALEILPMLKNMHSAEDNIMEVFYLENAVANFSSMSGESKILTL